MIDFMRGISTLLIFISFILLCWDTFRKSKKQFYDDAAMLPFMEDDEGVEVVTNMEEIIPSLKNVNVDK